MVRRLCARRFDRGVAVAGILSDRFGRRMTMLISAVFFTVSGIGCALSPDFTQLVIYRIIGGVGIGVVSIVSPMYISEVAVARWRGTLVSLYQLAITIGFLGAYLVNFLILRSAETAVYSSALMQKILVTEMWRGMLGSETLPALLFFIVIFFIPESPRWARAAQLRRTAHTVLERIYRSSEVASAEIAAVRAAGSQPDKVGMAYAVRSGSPQGDSDRRVYCCAGAVHGGQCGALLWSDDF